MRGRKEGKRSRKDGGHVRVGWGRGRVARYLLLFVVYKYDSNAGQCKSIE